MANCRTPCCEKSKLREDYIKERDKIQSQLRKSRSAPDENRLQKWPMRNWWKLFKGCRRLRRNWESSITPTLPSKTSQAPQMRDSLRKFSVQFALKKWEQRSGAVKIHTQSVQNVSKDLTYVRRVVKTSLLWNQSGTGLPKTSSRLFWRSRSSHVQWLWKLPVNHVLKSLRNFLILGYLKLCCLESSVKKEKQ